jgi:dCTP deaminase
MYSRIDILKAVREKQLCIEPFEQELLKPNAISFTLDNEIAIAKQGNVDALTLKGVDKLYRKKKLKRGEKFRVTPNTFLLARTREKVALGADLAMLVEGRSTLARLGISVTQTAMVIEAGHGVPKPRKIVLEVSNSGPLTVTLTPGMRIAKGTIFELKTPTDRLYDSYGKYGTRRDKDELLPLKG